ncbi:hypothetical protein GCM10028773_01330 [Spirosoma koreense]
MEPGKKYAYDVSIEGQKVSLPYPTLFQIQNRWPWQTAPPAFHFAVGSCACVNDPETDRSDKSTSGGYDITGAFPATGLNFTFHDHSPIS